MSKNFSLRLQYVLIFLTAYSFCQNSLYCAKKSKNAKNSALSLKSKKNAQLKKTKHKQQEQTKKNIFSKKELKNDDTTENLVCNPADVMTVTKGAKLLSTGLATKSVKAAYKRVLGCYTKNKTFFQNLNVVCSKISQNKYLAKTFSKTCEQAKYNLRPAKVIRYYRRPAMAPQTNEEKEEKFENIKSKDTRSDSRHPQQTPNYAVESAPVHQIQAMPVDQTQTVYGQNFQAPQQLPNQQYAAPPYPHPYHQNPYPQQAYPQQPPQGYAPNGNYYW